MASGSPLCFGPFVLHGSDEGLWRGPARCKLTAKAEAVLRYLVTHPGRLVRKTDLFAAVWPEVYVSDWALTTCIRELRHVLGDVAKAPQYIATVYRQGYRFMASVTVGAPPPLLASPAGAPPAAPARASLQPAALAEEHKVVTILCGALAEAPAMAVRLGPERWYRLLQTVVGLTQEVLQHYAGTLTLATSDGFTAVFGAPVAQEDHARRAVLAALELRQRLQDAPALHMQDTGGSLSLGMGLHAGLVVVGGLGQAPQRLATVVGAPLHVATRLQQQAAPGTILLSAVTYELVHAEVQATPCGTLAMDGQSTLMSVYAVQGLRRRYAGVAGRGPRAVSPFVGRERELALLHDHLAVARGGQGQVVGLVGAPGIGKTRLLTEFCRSVPGNQVTVYEGRCLSYGQGTPYLPVRDLVRQMCGLVEEDAPAGHTAAVQRRLHASGITAADDMALLLLLLDLPVAPECLAQLSPEAGQARTFALLRHLVLDAAKHQPLVLVVENLHWSDPTSEAWLASLVERLPEAPVLLLGTYRPGSQPAWGAHAAVTQVALPSLRAPESRRVVQAVLGPVALPEARLQALVAQAGGNPFFLEELAWHAVEQEGVDTPGAVPETVHAVLAARIDRLPSEEKRLLQTAAVVGPEVPVPLLRAIAELPEATLHRGLAHLQAAEFLYETRLFPEQVYTFKHALTHEVVNGSLLLERRQRLHARLVEALEGLAGDRVAEQVERLAHHALRGEVWEKAVTYLRQAGTKAAIRSSYQEAVTCCEQALLALKHLPENPTTLLLAFDLQMELTRRLIPLADYGRILEHLREAEAIAAAQGDRRQLALVCSHMTDYFCVTGHNEQAIACGERALAFATELGDFPLQVLANQRLGHAYHAVGNYRQAVESLQQNIASLCDELRHERFSAGSLPSVMSRIYMAWALIDLGEFTAAVSTGEEARRIADEADTAHSQVRAAYTVGLAHLCKGDFDRAIPLLEPTLLRCQVGHIPMGARTLASSLGYAYALSGRVAESVPLLERAVQQTEALKVFYRYALWLAWLGEAYLLAGRTNDALEFAKRAVERARTYKEPGHQAYGLRLLGEIATHGTRPDVDKAEAAYHQALTLAEPLGMRPLQAHCHRGLGTLYAKTGQREQARTALSTAIALYRAMDMAFWLPQAETALAEVDALDPWGEPSDRSG